MKIELKKAYKSLSPGILVDNLPDFVVLTGINGVGKTHLLSYLSEQGLDGIPIRLINYIGQNRIATQGTSFDQAFLEPDRRRRERMQEIRGDGIKGSENRHYGKNFIERMEGILGKPLDQASDDEILNNIPFDDQLKINSEAEIVQLFVSFAKWFEAQSANATRDGNLARLEELKKIYDEEAPWEIINFLFEKYGFHYRICELNKTTLSLSLMFKHVSIPNLNLSFEQLSSGEKQIVYLVLWSHNKNTGARHKLLLLDEPDAFIHPSMCRIVIDTIYGVLHKEYGIKVILVTHNPSTVVSAPEESIYVMSSNPSKITHQSKESAISILSDGIITLNDGMQIINNIYRTEKKLIVLVEGKTDAIHLQQAILVLQIENNFEIISLEGEDKLRSFIISLPVRLFGNKKLIAIFDADKAGLSAINNIQGKIQVGDFYCLGDCKYCCVLPVPFEMMKHTKNCAMEMLYPMELLKKQNVIEKMNIRRLNSLIEDGYQLNRSDYEGKDELWMYEVKNNKKSLADYIVNCNEFDLFENFKKIFDILNKIQLHNTADIGDTDQIKN